MPAVKKTAKRIKKENYWRRIQQVAFKYNNVLFVNADNVSSLQIAKMRVKLREIGAYMIMGKNVSAFYLQQRSIAFIFYTADSL